MPVLNVPFRLIFAHNGSRVGVLDNNFQPAKRFTFRFAVGHHLLDQRPRRHSSPRNTRTH